MEWPEPTACQTPCATHSTKRDLLPTVRQTTMTTEKSDQDDSDIMFDKASGKRRGAYRSGVKSTCFTRPGRCAGTGSEPLSAVGIQQTAPPGCLDRVE
jgi:hypothetical protein